MIEQFITEALSAIAGSELWGRIFFATISIFSVTEALKFVLSLHKKTKPSPAVVRLFAGFAAYPLTLATMLADGNILTHWIIPVPHALIAWLLAHYMAEYLSPFIKEFFPRLHKVLGKK